MKNTIRVYEKPQVVVRISQVVVNTTTRDFTLILETKSLDKRVKKFNAQQVSGKIKSDIKDFLTLMLDDKIKTVANNQAGFEWTKTGTKSTRFQRWCKVHGYTCTSGCLRTMVFECENNSPESGANPFKLVMNADGTNILSLVRTHASVKTSTVDPETGEIKDNYTTSYYRHEDGTWRKSFVAPKFYLRLIRSVEQEVEVYQQA